MSLISLEKALHDEVEKLQRELKAKDSAIADMRSEITELRAVIGKLRSLILKSILSAGDALRLTDTD